MSSVPGNYIFFGWPTVRQSLIPTAQIPFKTEDDCVRAAKHWASVTKGHTACYCVQDGFVGGRAFASFWGDDVVYSGHHRYARAGLLR